MKFGMNFLVIFIFLPRGICFAGEITISSSSGSIVAYISDDGRIEDGSRKTLGYVDSSGRIEDSGRSTLGYISSGRVENASHSTVLTYSGSTDLKKIGAYIFFFNKVLKKN